MQVSWACPHHSGHTCSPQEHPGHVPETPLPIPQHSRSLRQPVPSPPWRAGEQGQAIRQARWRGRLPWTLRCPMGRLRLRETRGSSRAPSGLASPTLQGHLSWEAWGAAGNLAGPPPPEWQMPRGSVNALASGRQPSTPLPSPWVGAKLVSTGVCVCVGGSPAWLAPCQAWHPGQGRRLTLILRKWRGAHSKPQKVGRLQALSSELSSGGRGHAPGRCGLRVCRLHPTPPPGNPRRALKVPRSGRGSARSQAGTVWGQSQVSSTHIWLQAFA